MIESREFSCLRYLLQHSVATKTPSLSWTLARNASSSNVCTAPMNDSSNPPVRSSASRRMTIVEGLATKVPRLRDETRSAGDFTIRVALVLEISDSPREPLGMSLRNLGATIARAVVHQQQFPRFKCLGEY